MPSRYAESTLVNFAVVGEVRSGSAIVQGTLNAIDGAVCHANLFHVDDSVRRACHEGYFGPSHDDVKPEWFVFGDTNPFQYINHRVLDNPLNGEKVVGLRITYDVIRRFELYDLFHDRCMEGDFCLIHVVRNPVACFVSQKQAEKTGVWVRDDFDAATSYVPMAISIDPEELTRFVRDWVSTSGKINTSCDDKLVIEYRDLALDYQRVMRKVIDFVELPDPLVPVNMPFRRLRNKSMRERIFNFNHLRAAVPSDVRSFMDAKDLF